MSIPGHNIVNLLYSIKLMAEAHLAEAREGRMEDRERRLEHAENVLERIGIQAGNALDIIRRIGQMLRKIQKEDGAAFREGANLREALESALTRFEPAMIQHGIQVLLRIPPGFPKIDSSLFELGEVMQILIQNAVQAMATSDLTRERKLIIRAELGCGAGAGEFARIIVADTGPGVPEKSLSKLFQPFYTTKPEDQGNGLGLFLVSKLIAKNNGKISLASFEGCGTSAVIELPFVTSPMASPVTA